jgi:phosphopantothenoylcysteine decarboxylase/phosphopantothenoylcysteine decarboxylase/phosphopantothenate--cysteine ligase
MFEDVFYEDIRHISLAKGADIAVIAPATASVIGKLASGIADDMLTTVIMAMTGKPVLICPAMNTAMWKNPILRGNVEKLKASGFFFAGPAEGNLACGERGRGALAELDEIVKTSLSLLEKPAPDKKIRYD